MKEWGGQFLLKVGRGHLFKIGASEVIINCNTGGGGLKWGRQTF